MVRGEASEIRAAHSRYFAGREADILDLWDSPRQREAYTWFTTELARVPMLTAAILTNQADYSTMPTVDPLRNTAAT